MEEGYSEFRGGGDKGEEVEAGGAAGLGEVNMLWAGDTYSYPNCFFF